MSYALAKLAFTDGKTYQFMASQMTGMTEKEYVDMMIGRGALAGRLALQIRAGGKLMAKIIAGVGTSHTPAIGAAVDNGKTGEPYWAPLFKGYEPAKKWMAETKPDVVIMVYNDHVNAFDFKIIPDLRTRLRRRVQDRRRRLGRASGARRQGLSRAGLTHGSVAGAR